MIDFVSDDFESKRLQTPMFVTRADFTEPFCTIPEELDAILSSIDQKVTAKQQVAHLRLVDYVKQDATRYSSREQAMQRMEELQIISKGFAPSSDLVECFDISIETIAEYDKIPNKESIASWLRKWPQLVCESWLS